MAIQLKRGTAAAWTTANTVLLVGQPGIETDTRKWKIGDGTTVWNDLDYMLGDEGGGGTSVHSGVAVLASGEAVIEVDWVTADTVVVALRQAPPATAGKQLSCDSADHVPGTSFTIKSEDATDSGLVFWMASENTELVPAMYVSWEVSFDAAEIATAVATADMIDGYKLAGADPDDWVFGIWPDFDAEVWYFDSNDGNVQVPQVFAAATTYEVGFKLVIDGGVGTLTPRVDGVDYAPFNVDGDPVSAILSINFGGRYPGGGGTTHRNLDNLKIGTTGFGSTDIFSADFASAIVPPFDSETGSGMSIDSGTLLIDNAGIEAYAVKDITFPS